MRRRRHSAEVSLFPFLSVLVCMIGALSMIIIGTTLGSAEEAIQPPPPPPSPPTPPPPPPPPPGPTPPPGSKQTEMLTRMIQLKEEELNKMLQMLRDLDTLKGDVQNLRGKTSQRTGENVTLEEQLAALTVEIMKALQQLRQRQEPPPPPASVEAILVVPPEFQGQTKMKPILVDCRGDGLVILQSGRRIPTAEIRDSKYLTGLLSDVKLAGNWCVLMLVRKDGVKAFDAIQNMVLRQNIPHGYVPIMSEKNFDARAWQKPGWLKN